MALHQAGAVRPRDLPSVERQVVCHHELFVILRRKEDADETLTCVFVFDRGEADAVLRLGFLHLQEIDRVWYFFNAVHGLLLLPFRRPFSFYCFLARLSLGKGRSAFGKGSVNLFWRSDNGSVSFVFLYPHRAIRSFFTCLLS